MREAIWKRLAEQVDDLRRAGLYKPERSLASPQGAHVRLADGRELLNLCANNYLGLANHPEVIQAAQEGLQRWGFGLSSVRFICGTQTLHKELEDRLSDFLGTEDTLLFSSCWDANGGVFEALLGPEDAVLSDELNHASLIDGIRLCKARRFRYRNNDMEDLEAKLMEAADTRCKLIVTDGVFSMDGALARLPEICDLAKRHHALTMIDDSHAVGFLGRRGRGTHEHCDVMGRVDLITGTLGKALGGASGGYASGRREIIELLRQRARPYLFSNTVAPPIVAAAIKVLDMLTASTELRDRLEENTTFFRSEMVRRGFGIPPGIHPIVPILLGEASLAVRFADAMFEKGVYVVGFFYPVVPKGQARVRVQISAAHSREDLLLALDAFSAVRREIEA